MSRGSFFGENQNTYFTVFWYFHFYKSYLGVSTFLVNPVYHWKNHAFDRVHPAMQHFA